MELIFKASAAALSAAVLSLIVKKFNPEISLLLDIIVSVVIVSASLSFLSVIRELGQLISKILKGSETLLLPVLKCLAIAVITKVSAELCRDSSQSAAASALEFAGSVCALSISAPLILKVLNLIGGFI